MALHSALDQPELLEQMQTSMDTLRMPPASAQIAEDLVSRYLTHITGEAAAIRPRLAFPNSRYV
jgi:processive 1,2-diacylglycerol beta-glucosyltransferase